MTKIFTLLIAAFFLHSCTNEPSQALRPALSTHKELADVRPVTNPSDLRQLLKSLPIWENYEPGFADRWIADMGSLQGDTLTVVGDGAQEQLRLTKLPATNTYELEEGTLEWPEGGHTIYRLKRIPNGWNVLSRD